MDAVVPGEISLDGAAMLSDQLAGGLDSPTLAPPE